MYKATMYRVEAPDGWGLFRQYMKKSTSKRPIIACNLFPELLDRHAQNMPSPSFDLLNLGLHNKEWFCAYKTLEQITLFLPELPELITDYEIKIYELTVTEFQEGGHQFLYTKESILEIKDISKEYIIKY